MSDFDRRIERIEAYLSARRNRPPSAADDASFDEMLARALDRCASEGRYPADWRDRPEVQTFEAIAIAILGPVARSALLNRQDLDGTDTHKE